MGFHTKSAPRTTTRGLEPELRRARLLAAREYPAGGVVRRGILSGQWDGGEVVRAHLGAETDQPRPRKRLKGDE